MKKAFLLTALAVLMSVAVLALMTLCEALPYLVEQLSYYIGDVGVWGLILASFLGIFALFVKKS